MYTYLLGWSKLNTYYYGVRYAKNARPEDLGKTYFSSSKYVKQFIADHGNPDIIEIRKVFDDKWKAMLWEHKVLRRLNAVFDARWLNKTDNIAIDFHGMEHNTAPGLKAAIEATKGKTYEEIYGKRAQVYKDRNSAVSRKNWDDPGLRARMSRKPADTSRYREAALRRWANRRA